MDLEFAEPEPDYTLPTLLFLILGTTVGGFLLRRGFGFLRPKRD